MSLPFFRRFRCVAALGLLAALCLSSSAHALFPPPYFYPPGIITGGPDPEPPPSPPDIPPDDKPPCECSCPPTETHGTPEPATMVSGLLGLGMLGGYMLRKRRKK